MRRASRGCSSPGIGGEGGAARPRRSRRRAVGRHDSPVRSRDPTRTFWRRLDRDCFPGNRVRALGRPQRPPLLAVCTPKTTASLTRDGRARSAVVRRAQGSGRQGRGGGSPRGSANAATQQALHAAMGCSARESSRSQIRNQPFWGTMPHLLRADPRGPPSGRMWQTLDPSWTAKTNFCAGPRLPGNAISRREVIIGSPTRPRTDPPSCPRKSGGIGRRCVGRGPRRGTRRPWSGPPGAP